MKRKALISVLNGENPRHRPVWFMRQAGRYLPEYRAVRQQAGSFLDLCYSSTLAAEVTLQPLSRYDLDAAIIFADILVVPHAMGCGLKFVEGEGPVLDKITSYQAVNSLSDGGGSFQFEAVAQSLSLVKQKLPPHVALIGFCGAPWTVASYMVEGGSSERELARKLAFLRQDWLLALIDRLVETSVAYLVLQVQAGAEVIQIFDSWAGDLSGDLFDTYSVKPLARLVSGFKEKCPDIPVIVFAKGANLRHTKIWAETSCQALGVEAETDLEDLRRLLPPNAILQGNLDPLALLCDEQVIRQTTRDILKKAPLGQHIFNLGHGIRQQTSPQALTWVIEEIRQFDRG